jgi:hypothetical protein
MEYKFVHIKSKYSDKGGWWLEVTSLEQLFDYHEKTDRRWGVAVENWINSKESTGGTGMEHLSPLALAISLSAESKGHSIIDATLNFKRRMIENQIHWLKEEGVIYINCKGGYCFKDSKNSVIDQYVRRKELIFPNYTINDIRITRFPMGEHYYAHIGDLELKDGSNIKWNSYQEAKDFAMKYVEGS